MVKLIGLAALAALGVGAWQVGDALTPAALNIGLGVMLGIIAPVPSLILLGYAIRQGVGRQQATGNMAIEVVHRLALPESAQAINGTCTGYSVARPFGLLEVDR